MQKLDPKNENIFFNNEHIGIINTYKLIHRFFFKRLIFLIPIALVGYGTYYLLQNHQQNYLPDYKNYIEELQSNEESSQKIEHQDLEVISQLGPLNINEFGYLETSENFVKYQGLILGNNALIDLNTPLFNQEKFEKKAETEQGLQSILSKLLKQKEFEVSEHKHYTLSKDLIQNFNIMCIEHDILHSPLCEKYFQDFLKYGIYYNIKDFGQEISTIIQHLQNDPERKSDFCNFLLEYISTSKEGVDTLENAIVQCDSEMYKKFLFTKNLIEINQELKGSIINTKIYNDKDINAYKALSLMKILYKNFADGIYNKTNINNYLTFIQELINKDNYTNEYLAPIYKDLIYVFNKNILQKRIEISKNETFTKTELSTITNKITLINKGDNALGNIGLEKQLTTPNIVNYKKIQEFDNYEVDIESLLNGIFTLKNRLKIINYIISEDNKNVEIQSELLFQNFPDVKFKAKILLSVQDNTLYVQDITVLESEEITEYLRKQNEMEKSTLPQLLNLLNDNIGLFLTETLSEEDHQICQEFAGNEKYLATCEGNQMFIHKNGIDYTFTIENQTLTNFSISDKEKEEEIRTKLETVVFNSRNSVNYIKDIINHGEEEVIIEPEEDPNIGNQLIIKEKFKDYLFTNVEIQETDDPTMFITTFTIKDVTLKGRFEIPTSTLWDITFVIDKDTELLIKDLEFILLEEYKETLSYISNNPRTYLKRFNTAIYDKYLKLTTEKPTNIGEN